MRALLWETGHGRSSSPVAAGRALHVPLSAGPSALRCLHFIRIFEPSKRTEKKSLCKLSVMHVPQKKSRTESSRKQWGSRGERWRSELTEPSPGLGPAPAAASASETAGVGGAGGIQEPLGGNTDTHGQKELPTGKAQNSRSYKGNSIITNILITTKET